MFRMPVPSTSEEGNTYLKGLGRLNGMVYTLPAIVNNQVVIIKAFLKSLLHSWFMVM